MIRAPLSLFGWPWLTKPAAPALPDTSFLPPERRAPKPAEYEPREAVVAEPRPTSALDPDELEPRTQTKGPKPWLQRRFGECAWPVSGEGVDLVSCCDPCGEATYCKKHRAAAYVGRKKA